MENTALARTEPPFNAVIEGSYHDDWNHHHAKLAQLDVPDDVQRLNDGVYKYALYGRYDNNSLLELKPGDLEKEIGFLGFCNGVMLPVHQGLSSRVLERPRSFLLRDGRVFVEEHMLDDQEYMKILSQLLQQTYELFDRKDVAACYLREVK
jgi:hypothetical protein